MNYVTSIGLDVHARSIYAAAFNPLTGEIIHKKFGYSPTDIAKWVLSFEMPKAAYESGVTGFHLARTLQALGVNCVVGAVSKMQKPAANKRNKTDRRDAEFIARLLATHNITEVFIPDAEGEAARDLTRALADARDDVVRAKHRLSKFLMRHGYVFDEYCDNGTRKSNWTQAHWKWMQAIDFVYAADRETLEYYIACVEHAEAEKKKLQKVICMHAKEARWRDRVDALRALRGIETVTAFALTSEVCFFSRFDKAKDFAAWLGLVPSEHSSGTSIRKGGITKSGNSHLRKLLIESSWHFVSPSTKRKRIAPDQKITLRIESHADKANNRLINRRRYLLERGKKSVVANCATARELSCWIWSIGRMAEGSL